MTVPVNLELIVRTLYSTLRASEGLEVDYEGLSATETRKLRNGIMSIVKRKCVSPSSSHELWCNYMFSQGWELGPYKNAVLKTHPGLVPWYMLPKEQALRDGLYLSVVNSFLNIED